MKCSIRAERVISHWMPALLVLACLAAHPVRAVALSVTVSPLLVELTIPAGGVRTTTVEVHNTGGREAEVSVNLSTFRLGETGTVDLSGGEGAPADWLIIRGESRFLLRPDEVRRIPLEVRPPRGTRGGLYAAVVFEVTPYPMPRGQAVGIRSGTLVFLSILRTTEARGTVGEATLDPVGPGLTATFANTGNAHWSGEGRAVITNQEGRVIERLTLESGTGLVLPGGIRLFTGVGTRNLVLPPGTYRVEVRLYAHTHQRPISLDRRTFEVVVPTLHQVE